MDSHCRFSSESAMRNPKFADHFIPVFPPYFPVKFLVFQSFTDMVASKNISGAEILLSE
jgi:hypothetical protein